MAAPEIVPSELRSHAGAGSAVARRLRVDRLQWTEEQIHAFLIGFRAEAQGEGYPPDAGARRLLDEINRLMAMDGTEAGTGSTSVETSAELALLRNDLQMQVSDSGLMFLILSPGSGPRPQLADTVVVSLAARLPDGVTELPEFGATELRVAVENLLPGLAEGVRMIALGGSAMFVLPPSLSFGDQPWPESVARGTPLLFKVDLHDIITATP